MRHGIVLENCHTLAESSSDGPAGPSVTTSADGHCVLTGVPTGMQTIDVRRDGYMRTWREVVVAADQTLNLPDVTLLGGDVNGDDVIGQLDAKSIGVGWNATAGSRRWNARADITDQGKVNLLEIVAAQYNWGQQAPGPWGGP